MSKLEKIVLYAVVVVSLVLGVVAFFGTSSSAKLGGTVENFPVWFYNGLKIGTSGQTLQNFQFGTCTLSGATTIATGTVATLSCAASGVVSGDETIVRPTSAITYGWDFRGSSASTTAGYIDVRVQNDSSTTTIPATTLSAKYFIFR